MTNAFSYLFSSAYSGLSPFFGASSALCTVNGQSVACPSWLGDFSKIFSWFFLAVVVFMVVSMWKVFQKAGKPGWAAIIPIYNTIVMLQIAKKPIWWIILYFIPIVNIVISIIVVYNISLAFGKGGGFALGMILFPFIFYPILAFGKATYMNGGQTSVPPSMPPQAAPPPATPPQMGM